MPGYDNPNRPEWTGKRKAKNFARINAACKGLKKTNSAPAFRRASRLSA